MKLHHFRRLVALALILAIETNAAAWADEKAEAERILTEAGIKTDPDALFAFFRSRTLSEADRVKLAATVRRLGADAFADRNQASADLVAAGPSALPLLRPALLDPDLEIVRRAERCLEMIERGPGTLLPMAAARLLAAGKRAGAAEALLGFYPFAEDEDVADVVITALEAVGLTDGKADPVLLAALDDREPARRAAAAQVLCKARGSEYPRAVARLLTDPVALVRWQAARSLVRAGDPAGVPPLMTLLSEATAELAWQVEDFLSRLAGDTRPTTILGEAGPADRRRCRDAWEAWWKARHGKIDLAGTKLEPPFQGWTLIADLDKGRINAFGPDGKPGWHVDGFLGPVDAHLLANGHVLVAENHGSRVTERDRAGKVVWQKRTEALPASCQRLPNGNTFIAVYNQLLVVAPDGKELFSQTRSEGVYSARRLRNGHMVLVTSTGRVVTLDAAGKEIASFETGGVTSWSSVEVLANGHCLTCCRNNRVVEFDASGRPVWEYTAPNAVCASRARFGHTLVCDSEGRRVVEVDRWGQTQWEQKTEGRPWHVRRQ
jgi:YD repeat-containing protein